MVVNQFEFEDEQGVEVDDDEAQEVDRGEFGTGAVIRKVAAAPKAPSAKTASPPPKAKPAPKKVLGKRTRSESASQDKSGESVERDSDDDE